VGLLRHESERVNRMRDMAPVQVSRTYAEVMGSAASSYDWAVRRIARYRPVADSILDVGTGPGFLPPRLARAYPEAHVTGIDTGPEMLAIAREKAEAEGLSDRMSYVDASAYEIPFADATFDLVVATIAIHGFDDLEAFFQEARRVLVEGGHFVVIDQRRDVFWPVYGLMWASTLGLRLARKPIDGMGPVIDACYTRGEVEETLARAGFAGWDVSAGILTLVASATA